MLRLLQLNRNLTCYKDKKKLLKQNSRNILFKLIQHYEYTIIRSVHLR